VALNTTDSEQLQRILADARASYQAFMVAPPHFPANFSS
jgi:hypothetical protein